jgi:hypothetical protein
LQAKGQRELLTALITDSRKNKGNFVANYFAQLAGSALQDFNNSTSPGLIQLDSNA